MIEKLYEKEVRLAQNILLSNYFDCIDEISPLSSGSPNLCWLATSGNEKYVLRKCVRNNNREWLSYQEEIIDKR